MWGESDRMIAPAYGDAFLRHLPHAELVRIPEAGPMAPCERPEAVIAAIAKRVPRS